MSPPLTTAEFAQIAGISNQKARRALALALSGKPWRGVYLGVTTAYGRGGERGISYLVRPASLPPELQEALKARLAPVERPSIEFAEHGAAERDWWLRMLGPLLKLPRGPERASAIATLAAQDNLTDWAGRPIALTDRTIRRRLKQYYDQGAVAFAPRARADKGRPKVIISLKAEQAIPFDTETWEDIASKLRAYIRGHWKENVTYMLIQSRANERFGELLKEAGFDHAHTLPPETLDVPRRFIEAERRYRNVASGDNAKPTTRPIVLDFRYSI